MSVQNIASPAPGQGVADRGAPRGRYNPTRGHRQPAPFAALPHDIAGRSDVTPLGKAVLLALLFWARSKDRCWPSDATIGLRVSRHAGTVQRTLRSLESLGLIAREKTKANRTGRVIYLTWLSACARSPQSPALAPPAAPALDEGDRIRERDPLKEIPVPSQERRRPDEPVPEPIPTTKSPAVPPIPAPAPIPAVAVTGLTAAEQARLAQLPEATRVRVDEFLSTDSSILHREARRLLCPRPAPEPSPESMALNDLLRGLPGRPDRLATAAGRLARELDDHRSYQFYQSVAAAVCQRAAPVEALVMALAEGMNPKSKRPGAVFATVWKRESRSM